MPAGTSVSGLGSCCRLAFAGGAALAYADGVGHAAGEAAAAWLAGCAPLWAAVAAAAEAGTRQEACLAEGVQATDAWAAETGDAQCEHAHVRAGIHCSHRFMLSILWQALVCYPALHPFLAGCNPVPANMV